jgi:hypothetical protein
MRMQRVAGVLFAILLSSASVAAHHGTAPYDLTKTITLSGTVTSFDWGNPHCLIHLDSKDEAGKVQHWTLELTSPFTLERNGWTKDSIKPGDQVAAETHPARNGLPLGMSAASGSVLKIVVNGQPLPAR